MIPARTCRPAIVGLAVALLLVSIPFRVNAKSAQLDFTEVTYGLSAKQLMTSRARFFVPGAESRIDIPLRARSASEDVPVEIEVLVDGSASETIRCTIGIGGTRPSTCRVIRPAVFIRSTCSSGLMHRMPSILIRRWSRLASGR